MLGKGQSRVETPVAFVVLDITGMSLAVHVIQIL